ncbi:MAG: response regulator [Myxococcota bacterium]
MPLRKESLERLVEASPDIVIATDAQGRVAYYNDGAHGILGYARDEVIGESVVCIYPDRAEAQKVMRAMREGGGRVENFETVFVAKDGRSVPCAISGVILYGPASSGSGQRREEGTIGFSKDLREIKRRDQLAVLGEIAIGLSHEINNPLSVAGNHLALLEKFLAELPSEVPVAPELARLGEIRAELRRIEDRLSKLSEMSEREHYTSTDYIGDARMIDLSESGSQPEAAGPLAGRHVLVVDDDRGVRDSVAELLRVEGCEVETAANGRTALARVEASPFDLVLSDVVMPEMDGYELYRSVQQRSPETVVALMTAFYYDKDHVIKRSRIKGLEGVLFKKPIDPGRLRSVLSGLLRDRRERGSGPDVGFGERTEPRPPLGPTPRRDPSGR